jgi:UDP-glucose:(glucosyl)LPS alpha-1,2-glucosyltransferase
MSIIWERNELNANSKGGTEMMMEGLLARLDPFFMDKFQIIPSRVRKLYDDRIRVMWLHDLPLDSETNHLKDQNSRDRFHKIVYCGQWQMNAYQQLLGIPQTHHTCVIDTAIEPIQNIVKGDPNEELRIVYTSTPQRGLELLVPVFEELCKHHKNIKLEIFSSFKIYGWEGADDRFKELFDHCKNNPNIIYHDYAPNEVVREAISKAHIFAYPSIWMECNSRSLIEAMSAKCICVHPNFGGLVDTSGGLTVQYQWDADKNKHANLFFNILSDTINKIRATPSDMENYTGFIKTYTDFRFNWDRISGQWNSLLGSLVEENKDKSLDIPAEKFRYRTS